MKILVILSIFLSLGLQASELEIMSYNAENLFDTYHDEGKNDWQYLPKNYPGKEEGCMLSSAKYQKSCLETDWTQEKLDIKIANLVHVIKTTRGNKLPDILTLSEVENKHVAKMLADKLGYTNVIASNGPDKRGIDLAVMFNETADLKLKEVEEHEVKGHKYFKEKPTRPILEVTFKVNKKYKLHLFVNHWPSQANPAEVRVKAASKLTDLVKKRLFLLKKRKSFVVAVGDFNTLPTDYPHPFHKKVYKEMTDVHNYFRNHKDTNYDVIKKMPLGTYFYPPKMAWNILDRVFVSPNLIDGKRMKLMPQSYNIHVDESFTHTFSFTKEGTYSMGSMMAGVPKRFNKKGSTAEEIGYSDHLATIFKLEILK